MIKLRREGKQKQGIFDYTQSNQISEQPRIIKRKG